MATPAQYAIVLGQKRVSVGADGDVKKKSIEFELPADAELFPAILQFMVRPTTNADNMAVNISINDKRVYHYGTTSERIVRMFQVVLDELRDFPLQRGTNVLTFEKTQGNGAFELSHFVIWFRQSAGSATAPRRKPAASTMRSAARKRRKIRKKKPR